MNPTSRPRRIRFPLALACLAVLAFLAGTAVAAPPDDDPFADSNKAGAATAARSPEKAPGKEKAADDDPFAEPNRKKPAAAEDKGPTRSQPSRGGPRNPAADRIHFDVSVAPQAVRRGQTFKLTITGRPA